MTRDRIVHLVADDNDALAVLHRTWEGQAVLLGHTAGHVLRIDEPKKVVVPLYDRGGPVWRRNGEAALLLYGGILNADVYVVALQRPLGYRYGMIAVPRTTKPDVRVENPTD